MRGNLDMNNNRMYNLAQPDGDHQPATNIYKDTNFLKLNGDNVMAGPLNMPNNKITHLAPATQDGDAVDYNLFNKYTPSGTRNNNFYYY